MNAVAAVPTRDELRQFVRETLCRQDHLDVIQTPFFEATLSRSGRLCGLYFEIHGPRLVRSCAVWASDEHRILFYNSQGERFAEVQLSEAPDLAGGDAPKTAKPRAA